MHNIVQNLIYVTKDVGANVEGMAFHVSNSESVKDLTLIEILSTRIRIEAL